jgi:hypothetical protein
VKRLSLLFLTLVWIAAAASSADVFHGVGLGAVVEAQQDPAKLTVYITKTGEKYHRSGCSSLRRSQFPISLKEAVARGYGACKICKPPTVG